MNIADRFFVYHACLSVMLFVGFSIHESKTGSKVVECTVERVVDSDDDEPVANERFKKPYTVVSYQPRWAVFDVPGDLGEPGQIVKLIPPTE
jgi:hypothetical protein